jgi:hypothetical protein
MISLVTDVSNRQDAHEALSIASSGKIQCHHEIKALSALSEYVLATEPTALIADHSTALGCMKAWNKAQSLAALF